MQPLREMHGPLIVIYTHVCVRVCVCDFLLNRFLRLGMFTPQATATEQHTLVQAMVMIKLCNSPGHL